MRALALLRSRGSIRHVVLSGVETEFAQAIRAEAKRLGVTEQVRFLGFVSPAEFIPIAEEAGIVNQLGEFALRAACAEAANLRADIHVTVNVSPVQFKNDGLVALVVDALDGPLARRLDVVRVQPNWSGEVLDLVVDFVTYVFVPAYAITASGLLMPIAAPILGAGVAISGALYFADRRMKTSDNHFRGFPALWNAAAFYLFLLHLPAALSSLAVAVLIALTFVPFNVVHPVRVVRLRTLTLSLIGVWAALAVITLMQDFDVAAPVTIGLCAIAVYIVGSDAAIRLARSLNA